MLPLIAAAAAVEAAPSPESLKAWLEVFLYLGGVILTGAGVYKLLARSATRTEISGQPVSVREAHEFVTQRDHAQLAGKMDAELGRERGSRKLMHQEVSELQGQVKMLASAMADSKTSVASLDRKIDENTKLTAKIDGQLSQINQSVHVLTGSVTQFLQNQARK